MTSANTWAQLSVSRCREIDSQGHRINQRSGCAECERVRTTSVLRRSGRLEWVTQSTEERGGVIENADHREASMKIAARTRALPLAVARDSFRARVTPSPRTDARLLLRPADCNTAYIYVKPVLPASGESRHGTGCIELDITAVASHVISRRDEFSRCVGRRTQRQLEPCL